MRLGWVRSGKAWILIVFTRKHQGTPECAAGGLCLHLKIKKKNSKNSVHKGAGYIGWLVKIF